MGDFLEKAPGVDVTEDTIFSSRSQVEMFLASIYEYGVHSNLGLGSPDNGLQYWTASPMTTTSMTFGWYNGKWIDFYDNDMGTARGLPIRCVRED